MPNRNEHPTPRWNIPTHTILLVILGAVSAWLPLIVDPIGLRLLAMFGLVAVWAMHAIEARSTPVTRSNAWPPPTMTWPAPDPALRVG